MRVNLTKNQIASAKVALVYRSNSIRERLNDLNDFGASASVIRREYTLLNDCEGAIAALDKALSTDSDVTP